MNKILYEDYERIAANIDNHKCSGKTFLVTGASGFLGKWIVNVLMYLNTQGLLDEECHVIALCRNGNKAKDIFSKYKGNKRFDILEQSVETPIALSENIDYIIHAASIATTSSFNVNPVGVLTANIIGIYNLLEFAKSNHVKAILFMSSGAVYGDSEDAIEKLSETDCFKLDFNKIENCYAEGKRVGELLCRSYWEQYHIPTKIVRISHTYGPGIDIEDGRIFSDFVKSILKGEDLVIKGSGMDSRPFCYISDAVIAFFKVLFSGKPGEAYNMANSKQTVTIAELAEILTQSAFLEKNLKVQYLQGRPVKSEHQKIIVNIEKLNQLGWCPEVDIVEGFRRTVQALQDNYF